MLSNGGCISTENFESAGINTVLSGPAGVIGAYNIAKPAGFDRIITFDMGGTSTDVSLCDQGISMTSESTISGLPIKVPLIDIHTVGAGGGSIATVDSGGALRVGPESAGAVPGPICYGNSGENITVTDANVFLGRISPELFLGGNMSLSVVAIDYHLRKLSDKVDISLQQTAEGILEIANATMERAIKVISVERGYDTRDFTLVSFGGAGGLHAAFLAENLGIKTVLIPPNGGLLSAYGMLFADVIKDYSQTVLWKTDNRTEELNRQLEIGFESLLTLAVKDMKKEGFALDELLINCSLDMRYEGQSYELCIPYYSNEKNYLPKFHAMHQQRFSYARPDAVVEVVNLRLNAIGETEKAITEKTPLSSSDPSNARIKQGRVVFDGENYPTEFYSRESLKPGNRVKGPAVITEFSSTTIVPPNFIAEVDGYGILILKMCI